MKNRIALLRKERGLTQQALAETLKVSRQTVISLENGRYNPSIRLAYDIARVFDCIIEEVFLFEEEEETK
ncbi:MAG: helix-turn-helix transcriptional regulator [Clostridia bacterium]